MQSVPEAVHRAAADAGGATVELLLFRLGGDGHGDGHRGELFGLNVVNLREIVAMPPVTAIAGSLPHVLGVVNLRGAIMQVLDLPSLAGCVPATGLNIMLVTDVGGKAQAFAVEEIVLIEADDLVAGGHGAVGGMIGAVARVSTGPGERGARLAQVIDVATVLGRLTA